jgi:hypothetical protein
LRGIEPALKDVHLSAAHVYDVGCVFALASAAAAGDGHLASAERSRRAEQHAVRSMEWLERAFATGYTDLDNLKQDKELDSLRARADFKNLVATLEAARRQGGLRLSPEKSRPLMESIEVVRDGQAGDGADAGLATDHLVLDLEVRWLTGRLWPTIIKTRA